MKPRINQSILFLLTLIFPFALAAQTNIAKGKTARQFPDNATLGRATNAVDGNTSGKWMTEYLTITATGEGDHPWWSVDLGAVYDISEIRIWNRTDACCWNRLQNFYVMVSEEPITANSTTTHQYVPGPLKFNSADESSMPLQNNARGRYIRIFISGKKILSLAEVEVFGKPVETNSPTNVAKGKTARQSSNWYNNGDGTAMKAVDGNASGLWQYGDGNTISHTKEQKDPWWEVDLGTAYDISEIKIYNRIGNWTWNRLQNFYVMVSENPIVANSTTDMQYEPGPFNFTNSTQASITLKNNTRGRYVRIFIQGNNKILSLAEVEVLATLDAGKNIQDDPDPISEGIWFVIQNKNDLDSDFDIPARRMALQANETGTPTMAQIPLTSDFDAFLWRTISSGDNRYKLVNKKLGEAKALDCSQQNPWMGDNGNYSGQQWALTPANLTNYGTNVYTLSNNYITDSKALQYAGGSVTFAAKNTGDTRQCWVFQPIELVAGYRIPFVPFEGFDRRLSLPHGYKVVATDNVSDWALLNAHLIYKNMLVALQQQRIHTIEQNTSNYKTILMMSKDDPNEVVSRSIFENAFRVEDIAKTRGGESNGIILITEEMMNKVGVISRGDSDKIYREFEQVIHEFGHTLDHIFGLNANSNPLAQEPRNCWFPFMTQFWFNNMQSGGPNRNRWIDLEGFDKAEKEYLGTIFNPSNTWLPPRWLRDR